MKPEPGEPGRSFALLASGAAFSCEVLDRLLQCRRPPDLLVLPEYPPADMPAADLLATAKPRRLLQLAQDTDVEYAPAAWQNTLAAQVRQRGFDFLLIACWPYLLAPALIESPLKATLNLHPSLLPAYRGPDPLAQQLATQDRRFGVSLHLLNQQFDHGDIVAQAEIDVAGTGYDRADLERRCAHRGVELFLAAAEAFPDWRPTAQAP